MEEEQEYSYEEYKIKMNKLRELFHSKCEYYNKPGYNINPQFKWFTGDYIRASYCVKVQINDYYVPIANIT
jgi:hypothetical protein